MISTGKIKRAISKPNELYDHPGWLMVFRHDDTGAGFSMGHGSVMETRLISTLPISGSPFPAMPNGPRPTRNQCKSRTTRFPLLMDG